MLKDTLQLIRFEVLLQRLVIPDVAPHSSRAKSSKISVCCNSHVTALVPAEINPLQDPID